jgi:RNA polymerase sigma-70 factor (ECF subfamily)
MALSSEPDLNHVNALIARSIGGDRNAFRRLVESHERYAHAIAYRLLHDDEDARDVVQEAFIRVWKHLGGYRPEIKFTTWLYKLVVNLCYDTMKAQKRKNAAFGLTRSDDGYVDVADPAGLERQIEQSDICERVLMEARKLPPLERLIFHLRDIENCSVEEAAGIAGVSVASVKTNLCYARKRLRIAIRNMEVGS